MIDIIKDSSIDDYNRMMVYYLFKNYNYNLEDEGRKLKNEGLLAAAAENLPAYISKRLIVAGKE